MLQNIISLFLKPFLALFTTVKSTLIGLFTFIGIGLDLYFYGGNIPPDTLKVLMMIITAVSSALFAKATVFLPVVSEYQTIFTEINTLLDTKSRDILNPTDHTDKIKSLTEKGLNL